MLMGNSIRKTKKKKCMFLWWIEKVVCRPPGPGHGTVEEYDPVLSGWEITVRWGSFSIMTLIIMTLFIVLPQIEGVTLLLGGWWLEAAKRGGPDTLPVINLSPEVRRERALSLSLEPLFIHTSSCLMSDYFLMSDYLCTLLPTPDKTSADLS